MAKTFTNEERMTIAEGVISIFEEFLDNHHIEINNPEKVMADEEASNIYGTDYYDLECSILDYLARTQLISRRVKKNTK